MKKRVSRANIAGFLLVLWLVILIYAFLFASTPTISYSPYFDTATFPAPCNPELIPVPNACAKPSGIPPTFVSLFPSFKASGAFSVENPIKITCTLYANRSNLLQYYRGIGFLGAEYLNGTSQGVLLPLTSGGYDQNAGLYVYQAVGTLKWANQTNVDWFLIPQQQYFTPFLLGPSSNTTSILLRISSFQDTLNTHFNTTNLRLTWVALAFSVIVLQPILEAIFLDEEQRKKGDSNFFRYLLSKLQGVLKKTRKDNTL